MSLRKVRRFCGSCHHEILEGEEIVLESDLRGVLSRIFHKRCVWTPEIKKEEVKKE